MHQLFFTEAPEELDASHEVAEGPDPVGLDVHELHPTKYDVPSGELT